MSEINMEMSRRGILFALYSVEDLDKMSMDIKVSYSILNELSLRNERTVDFLVLSMSSVWWYHSYEGGIV